MRWLVDADTGKKNEIADSAITPKALWVRFILPLFVMPFLLSMLLVTGG
jgi:hypothetical protein